MVRFAPDPGPTPDADLVEALGRGDTMAFGELYERYRDWVVRLAYRLTGNERDALEILHGAFARFLRTLPRLQMHAELSSFLYQGVTDLAAQFTNENRGPGPGEAVQPGAPGLESAAADTQEAALAAAVAALPKRAREILLMRFAHGMSSGSIADALTIPENVVKSALHQAMTSLRSDSRTQTYFQE